jgi:hypothetical protein
VGNRVEVALQVCVIDFPPAGLELFADRFDGLMRRAARTESVRAVNEVGLEDRLQHQEHGRLDDAVPNGGNAQRSLPSVWLGNHDAFDWLGSIAVGAQFLAQLVEEGRGARTIDDVLTRLAIHAGGAMILPHQPPSGRQHVVSRHSVIQSVEPESRLSFGLVAQLPPESRDGQRQRHARLHLRLVRRLIGVVSGSRFRSGT